MDRRIRTAPLAACLLGACAPVAASTVEYLLELPANRRLAYELEFEVAHPGRVAFLAEWSPTRVLVFRLDRPGQPPLRLAGPPPRSFAVEVGPEGIDDASPWKLTISGLPSRRAAEGRLRIDLPESPEAIRAREEQRAADEPPPPEPDPWRLPADAPLGVGPEGLRLYEAIERFRRMVIGSESPDAYRWQDGMLRYLAGKRDAVAAGAPPLRHSTRRTLERIVGTIRQLDDLRFADSEPLGAEPTDPVRRRAWQNVRAPRFVPLEGELDALMAELHRGHAPELERELWFTNFLSCVIVCERHFEERARLGEERASNKTLVRHQWQTVVAAADALSALLRLP